MGLDLYVRDDEGDERMHVARWSYRDFHRMRTELAALVGITLEDMKGFDGTVSWDTLTPDPLHHFIDHSDCDGELSPEKCRLVAPRLAELAPRMSDVYDREMLARLAAAMTQCGEESLTLEFS